MTIELPSAKIIAHSVSPLGIEIATLQTRMPRIILAEFNTHGAIAKNARSTRAVPTSKLIKEVRENPYIPVEWGKNIPGMKSNELLDSVDAVKAESYWKQAAVDAANYAEELFNLGLHKQWAGRVLEPFMWVDSVITSTDWANFQALRNHNDAQPEIRLLAEAIDEAIKGSTPSPLPVGVWHLPYIDPKTYRAIKEYLEPISPKELGNDALLAECWEIARKISVARCARVSYAPFDGNGSIEKELERYDLLVNSKPVHASPTEHQCTPDTGNILERNCKKEMFWDNQKEHGRFYGWRQYRRMIEGNTIWDEHYNV